MKTKEKNEQIVQKVDHSSHRQRLYQNVENMGLDKMNEISVMEFILTYVLTRVDTNPTAHRLLDKFGSVANVLEALPSEIENVFGMGKNSARLLCLLPQIFNYYQQSKQKSTKVLKNKQSLINYCKTFLQQKNNEELYAICLDKNSKILSKILVAKGTVNEILIDQKSFLRQVLNIPNAHFLVLAHSHPNGTCNPSNQDTETTKKLKNMFLNVDITLLEHIIIGDKQCYCILEDKYYAY